MPRAVENPLSAHKDSGRQHVPIHPCARRRCPNFHPQAQQFCSNSCARLAAQADAGTIYRYSKLSEAERKADQRLRQKMHRGFWRYLYKQRPGVKHKILLQRLESTVHRVEALCFTVALVTDAGPAFTVSAWLLGLKRWINDTLAGYSEWDCLWSRMGECHSFVFKHSLAAGMSLDQLRVLGLPRELTDSRTGLALSRLKVRYRALEEDLRSCILRPEDRKAFALVVAETFRVTAVSFEAQADGAPPPSLEDLAHGTLVKNAIQRVLIQHPEVDMRIWQPVT